MPGLTSGTDSTRQLPVQKTGTCEGRSVGVQFWQARPHTQRAISRATPGPDWPMPIGVFDLFLTCSSPSVPRFLSFLAQVFPISPASATSVMSSDAAITAVTATTSTVRSVNMAYTGFQQLPTETLEMVIYATGAVSVPSAKSLVSTCRRLYLIWHGDDSGHRNRQMSRLLTHAIGKEMLPAAMMRLRCLEMHEHIKSMDNFLCDVQAGANANRISNHVGYYYSKDARGFDFGSVSWPAAALLRDADEDVTLVALQYFEDATALHPEPCPPMTATEFDRVRRTIYLLDHTEVLRDCTQCVPRRIRRQHGLDMPEMAFSRGISMLEAVQVGMIQGWLTRFVHDRLTEYMYGYNKRRCCPTEPDARRPPCPICETLVTHLTSSDFAYVLQVEARHRTQPWMTVWRKGQEVIGALRLYERFRVKDLRTLFALSHSEHSLTTTPHALFGLGRGQMPPSFSSYPTRSESGRFRQTALFEDTDPGPYSAMHWGFEYEDRVSEAQSEEEKPVYGTDCCRKEHEPCMWDRERLRLLTGGLLPTYMPP